jgi:hypothetical protein
LIELQVFVFTSARFGLKVSVFIGREKEIVFNCFFTMGHHYMIIFLLFALVVLENTGFVGFTSVFERYFALFVVDELNLVFFA